MSTKRCAWGICNSDSRYKHKEYMENVSFKPFPKPHSQKEKCLKWISLCGRPHEDLNASRIGPHHFVCSKHFVDGSDDPLPADSHSRIHKKRKCPAVRSVSNICHLNKKIKVSSEPSASNSEAEKTTIDFNETNLYEQHLPAIKKLLKNSPVKSSEQFIESSKNVVFDFEEQKFPIVSEVLRKDSKCFFYTGVPTVQTLIFLYNWLKPAAEKVKLWDGKDRATPGRKGGRMRKKLNLFEELVLTLIRIRRGFDNEHMAFLFKISQSHVSRIFITYVNLLSECLTPLLIRPTKEQIEKNLPDSFQKYRKTRIIIDCTEYFVQKPLRPAAQKITWSSYKHANTFKQLIGISPTGTITFISKLYSGSISDMAIVKESNLLDKIESGDDIMADREFNIRHMLLKKKATLNIPAFSQGKCLSKKAVLRSRAIASVRIHVERAIRRMKTFKNCVE